MYLPLVPYNHHYPSLGYSECLPDDRLLVHIVSWTVSSPEVNSGTVDVVVAVVAVVVVVVAAVVAGATRYCSRSLQTYHLSKYY